MRTFLLAVVCLVTGCGYSHIATTASTFTSTGEAGTYTLRIVRDLDTVMRGPDDQEHQELRLTLHDVRAGQRYAIPSQSVRAEFTVTRFGPSSVGDKFTGTITVRSVVGGKLTADLDLIVNAHTQTGYTQTVKFDGKQIFVRTND